MNSRTAVKAEQELRFETLVRRHSRPVLAYCLRRSTHADAHEAAADVFAVAWSKFDQMPDGEETLYWLFGVARRVLFIRRGPGGVALRSTSGSVQSPK